MSIWGDPEEKKEKKLRKCIRNAVFSIGIGIGLLLLKTFYPDREGAEHITEIFGKMVWCLTLYGGALLAVVLIKKDLAPFANAVLTWIVVPAYIVYVFIGAFVKA